MTDRASLLFEAQRRGILPKEMEDTLQEAVRRGMLKAPGGPQYAGDPQFSHLSYEDLQGSIVGRPPSDPLVREYQRRVAAETPAQPKTEPGETDVMAKNQTWRDWVGKRGAVERVGDAAAFAASLPVRALTRGEYGAGDVAGAVSPAAGSAIKRSEENFAKANPDLLWGMGAVGEVAGGLPMTAAARPTRGMKTIESEAAAARAASIAEDMAAAQRTGVELPGFAYATGPTASVGKQLSETPIIGTPARRALERSYQGLSEAAEDIATRMSPAATPESAGYAVQKGMERFRNSRLDDLPVSTVEGVGLPSTVQAPANRVMSRGAQEAASEAAPIRAQIGADVAETTRGVTVPGARPRDEFLTVRSTPAQLTDDQLSHLIRLPATETSAAARAEALYERAWRKVPDLIKEDGKRNPSLLNATNTRSALASVEKNIANQISGQGTISGELADRLRNPKSNFTLENLRDIRTEVGRALGNYSPVSPGSLDRGQLKSLYGALSRDIEIGIETLANRAAIGTQRGNNVPNYVSPQVAKDAAQALYAMRTADRYFRLSMDRMDRFAEIVNVKSPEAAASRIIRAGREGTKGDSQLYRQAMGVLKPEERNQFSALVFQEMGRPVASARGMSQEAGWSPATFMTNWQAMSAEAKNMIFQGQMRAAVDDFVRTANKLANVEALTNTSRSGTNTINVGGLLATAGAVATGTLDAVMAGLGSAGGGFAAAYILSRPAYARWLAKYLDLKAKESSRQMIPQIATHIQQLAAFAEQDPQVLPLYQSVVRHEQVGKAPAAQKRNMGGEVALDDRSPTLVADVDAAAERWAEAISEEPPAVAHAMRTFLKQMAKDSTAGERLIEKWAAGDTPRDRYIADRLMAIQADLMASTPEPVVAE